MDFTGLKRFVEYLPKLGVPGCDLVVFRDHEQIFRCMAGDRDADGRHPMEGNEWYWMYSCSKVVTTCAAMQLIEKGKLNPDDPVCHYLPAYGHLTVQTGEGVRPASRVMTVRHLMSMQSGLDYNLQRPAVEELIRSTGGNVGTREIVDAFAKDPLCFEPGTDFLYSLSHDVLAAVIEVVSGERFSDYLKHHIFEPLGITGFDFRLRPEYMEVLCAPYTMENGQLVLNQPDCNNYHLTPEYESGGAGLIGNVRSFITLVDALACEGKGRDGYPLLSPEMLQLWSSNQLGPRSRASFDQWRRIGYSYGLGVRTRVNHMIGGAGPVGEFGWDGAAGAWNMIDIHDHVSAYFSMHVRNFGYAYDVIHPTIRSLIFEGLKA